MWPETPLPLLAFIKTLCWTLSGSWGCLEHKRPFSLLSPAVNLSLLQSQLVWALLCVGHTNLLWVTRGGSSGREAGFSTTAIIKSFGWAPAVSPNTTHLFSLSEERTNTTGKLLGILRQRKQTIAVAMLLPLITQFENIGVAMLLGAAGPETRIKQPVRLWNPIRMRAHLRGNAIFGGKIWLESSPIICCLCLAA